MQKFSGQPLNQYEILRSCSVTCILYLSAHTHIYICVYVYKNLIGTYILIYIYIGSVAATVRCLNFEIDCYNIGTTFSPKAWVS